jgi:pescadillo protein
LILIFCPGIFPREPRSRKKANKGSSAPTSFYYAKDIAYLAHEPILKKLREHKAFAKKLARALGRGEWSSAKSLEQNKPIYRLDHIIKERCVVISTPWIIILTSDIATLPLLMLCETSTTLCA